MSFLFAPFCRCTPGEGLGDDGKVSDTEEPTKVNDERPSRSKVEVLQAVKVADDTDKNSERSTAASGSGSGTGDVSPGGSEKAALEAKPEAAKPEAAKPEAKSKAEAKPMAKPEATLDASWSAGAKPKAALTEEEKAELAQLRKAQEARPKAKTKAKAKSRPKESTETAVAVQPTPKPTPAPKPKPEVKRDELGREIKPKKKKSKWSTDEFGKRFQTDEVGRRVYEESSSEDDSFDDLCPASKKEKLLDQEIKKMKKKMRSNWTEEQKEEMDNPWLHTQIGDAERDLKKNMFKSFYREQYARLKAKATVDLKQYEGQKTKDGSSLASGLVAEGGHRPMPRPRGVKLPTDFKKPVGTITKETLLKEYGCESKDRMFLSVYGDLFDVSDRPDKYGKDGPYWYMTGRDITWGLVCGEDSEENMDHFYDLFKIQPKEAADKRLQGLMSWWAFYEKEYGQPVGRNESYNKEWGLGPPPNADPNCSIM